MLPYAPLHHLLLGDAGVALVMTSGNVSDEPIAFRDDDALERLAGIADAFLAARPPDRDAHRRLGRARRARAADGAAPLARARAGRDRAAGRVRAAGARLRGRAEEHVLPGPRAARVGRPPHRRPAQRGDARVVPRGHRALRAALRRAAGGRRPRPAPAVPVDRLRAGARRRRARRRAAPPRAPRGVPGRARRRRRPRSARSTTAPATAPTGRPGAARSCSATCARSSGSAISPRSGCPAATGRCASRGGWRARGSSRRAARSRRSRSRCAATSPPDRWDAVARMALERVRGAGDDEHGAAVRRGRGAVRGAAGRDLRGPGGDRARGARGRRGARARTPADPDDAGSRPVAADVGAGVPVPVRVGALPPRGRGVDRGGVRGRRAPSTSCCRAACSRTACC